MSTQTITYDLGMLPERARPLSVTANLITMGGWQALRVTLTDKASEGEPNVDFIDMPTFLMIPGNFKNGTISVNLFSKLRDDAPAYARGFAGLAYRISDSGDAFEASLRSSVKRLKDKARVASRQACRPVFRIPRLAVRPSETGIPRRSFRGGSEHWACRMA